MISHWPSLFDVVYTAKYEPEWHTNFYGGILKNTKFWSNFKFHVIVIYEHRRK